ncbi:MAG: GNAT family N-acetyltransferase [Bacillota bacterium]
MNPITVDTRHGQVSIWRASSRDELERLHMHTGLAAFRTPERQKQALLSVVSVAGGRLYCASHECVLIGYIAFHPPEPFERWGAEGSEGILAMGGIEVAPEFRNSGVGRRLLEYAFSDPAMEDYIVISTEYSWHWDLKGTGLSVWEYRGMLEKLLSRVGLIRMGTDDPDILYHPANMLMVRVGKNVSLNTKARFERLRYKSKGG